MSKLKAFLKVAGLIIAFLSTVAIWFCIGALIVWMFKSNESYIISFGAVVLMIWFLNVTKKLHQILSEKISKAE